MANSQSKDMNMLKNMIGMGVEQSGTTSDTESNISLITDLLGEMGLSEEETNSILQIINDTSLDISA